MSVDFEFDGLLRLMVVVGTFVDVEVPVDGIAESVLREHAAHGVFEHEGGLALEVLSNGSCTLATRIAGVAHVVLLCHFVSSQDHFLCIDDDDIITTIAVGSKACLPFATQNHGTLFWACKNTSFSNSFQLFCALIHFRPKINALEPTRNSFG